MHDEEAAGDVQHPARHVQRRRLTRRDHHAQETRTAVYDVAPLGARAESDVAGRQVEVRTPGHCRCERAVGGCAPADAVVVVERGPAPELRAVERYVGHRGVGQVAAGAHVQGPRHIAQAGPRRGRRGRRRSTAPRAAAGLARPHPRRVRQQQHQEHRDHARDCSEPADPSQAHAGDLRGRRGRRGRRGPSNGVRLRLLPGGVVVGQHRHHRRPADQQRDDHRPSRARWRPPARTSRRRSPGRRAGRASCR